MSARRGSDESSYAEITPVVETGGVLCESTQLLVHVYRASVGRVSNRLSSQRRVTDVFDYQRSDEQEPEEELDRLENALGKVTCRGRSDWTSGVPRALVF